MNLYIIIKDGKPFNGSNMKKDTFVKAYYDETIAEKIAKSFCTAQANAYYEYGQGYYDNEELDLQERRKLAKELAEIEMGRWDVIEVSI